MYGRIIWSADVATPDDVMHKLEAIDKPIAVKLDRLFHRRCGDQADQLSLQLHEYGIPVFNDAKLIEIPSKLEELAKVEIEKTRPWMLNCMAGAVSTGASRAEERDELDGLKRFAEVCLNEDVLPCAVTVLTSKKDYIVRGEFNVASTIDQVLWYANFLVDFGFTDMVCSPLEAEAIRSDPYLDRLSLNCPGVRMPSDAAGDQARVATPGQALQNGVTRVVVGRPITRSSDPWAAVEAIAADMESAV